MEASAQFGRAASTSARRQQRQTLTPRAAAGSGAIPGCGWFERVRRSGEESALEAAQHSAEDVSRVSRHLAVLLGCMGGWVAD